MLLFRSNGSGLHRLESLYFFVQDVCECAAWHDFVFSFCAKQKAPWDFMNKVSLIDRWNPAKWGGADATARRKGPFFEEIVQLFAGDVEGLGQSIDMSVLKNHNQFLLPGCSLPCCYIFAGAWESQSTPWCVLIRLLFIKSPAIIAILVG